VLPNAWDTGAAEHFGLALRVGSFAHGIAWARQRDYLPAHERPDFDAWFAHIVRRALRRLAPYGARVLTRVSSLEGGPTEVQVLEFPSEEALEEFQKDPARLALAGLRATSIARTEILRVAPVQTD
jgi:uncharacterized protein (DUF1330 family)